MNVAAFSPHGRDLRNGEHYWTREASYSQGGHKIFVAGSYVTPAQEKVPGNQHECEISLWDAGAQKMLQQKNMLGEKLQLAIDPKGHYAALACDRTINIYDSQLEETVETMALAGSGNVLSMAFSPDGKKFAVRTAGAVSVYAVGG